MFIRIGFERLEVAKHPIPKETNRMNTHKHARLTFARRLQMVRQMTEGGLSACEAAAEHGVTPPTARKWLGRYLVGGTPALADASSRPMRSPRSIDPAKALLIVELRRRRMLQSRIARSVGVSESTVSRVLARAGLSRLSDLDPVEPVVRYEHEAPGELLHIDTKRLGRIQGIGHRITGDRTTRNRGIGWDAVHLAIDDHSRVSFAAIKPDETAASCVQFLREAVAWYAGMGVKIERVMTDNGTGYKNAFKAACNELGIRHIRTRPYTPQTNGKAERFVQTSLREWAYARAYESSAQRQAALQPFVDHYNWLRPHSALNRQPPMSRIPAMNNLLRLNR